MQVAMKFDKRFFFDRQAVADIVGKAAAKALGRAGAYVQRSARSSMRRAGNKARQRCPLLVRYQTLCSRHCRSC
jgi:hypothetical protein